MTDIAIRVENLSKLYHIGTRQERHDTLGDALVARFRRANQSTHSPTASDDTDLWALRDVSFDVKRGEVVGIIGRNGAGKSTLLKILSRITEPTSGLAEIHGRVGSLLEVGTGFHPELTGRENIYLNGAILGMRRTEIDRQFDEIVAFAEIERFLDTPVKRYSSGMYVRLAFAVAAHLEPEILLVDEVLAVGDMAFQKKCLAKMKDVAQLGRTILFVSHNMQAIQQLCQRTILLKQGQISFSGRSTDAILRYYGSENGRAPMLQVSDAPMHSTNNGAALLAIGFFNTEQSPCTQYLRSDKAHIRVHFSVMRRLRSFDIAMAVVLGDGVPVFSETLSDQTTPGSLDPGSYVIEFVVDLSFLKLEPYFLTVYLLDSGSPLDRLEGLPIPEIYDPSADVLIEARRWGIVRLPVAWSTVHRLEEREEYASPN